MFFNALKVSLLADMLELVLSHETSRDFLFYLHAQDFLLLGLDLRATSDTALPVLSSTII